MSHKELSINTKISPFSAMERSKRDSPTATMFARLPKNLHYREHRKEVAELEQAKINLVKERNQRLAEEKQMREAELDTNTENTSWKTVEANTSWKNVSDMKDIEDINDIEDVTDNSMLYNPRASGLRRTTSGLLTNSTFNDKEMKLQRPTPVRPKPSGSLGGRKRKSLKNSKKSGGRKTRKSKRGGGMFDILLGAERIRGQKYDKWLEQRLVSQYNDTEFVNEIRRKFGFDKTNIRGRGQLTKQMVDGELCARSEEDRKLISPNLNCSQSGGRKTRKGGKRSKKSSIRKTHKK